MSEVNKAGLPVPRPIKLLVRNAQEVDLINDPGSVALVAPTVAAVSAPVA